MAPGPGATHGYCRAVDAFFNHAGASPPTDAVVERMIRHLRREQEIGGYEAAAEVVDELAGVRATIADAIGAQPVEVALTAGATDAWERLAWAYLSQQRFDGGATIVVDPFTYVSMWTTLQRWNVLRPLTIVVAEPAPDGTVDLDSLSSLVEPDTAMVLLTHIPTHCGTVTPAAAAIAAARASAPEVLIALDVAQSAGQMALDVRALGSDVAFAPGRKFLRGPRGTGFLHVRHELIPTLAPLGLPFGARYEGDELLGIPGDATRFEVFERPIASLLGFGVAVGQLVERGLETVESEVTARSDEVRAVLDRHASLVPLGTRADRGIVTFTHQHVTPDVVAVRLAELAVATRFIPGAPTVTDGPAGFEPSVRLSPHHCTTAEEIAVLDEALSRLDA